MAGGERNRKFYQEKLGELLAFAEHEFRLGRKRADGASEREHLDAAQRQIAQLPGWKGKKEIIPEGPPFPADLGYLWELFVGHSLGLSANGMGPALVTWEGLHAWCELMGHELEHWEALALVRLGHLRAVIESENASKDRSPNGGQGQNRSGRKGDRSRHPG